MRLCLMVKLLDLAHGYTIPVHALAKNFY